MELTTILACIAYGVFVLGFGAYWLVRLYVGRAL